MADEHDSRDSPDDLYPFAKALVRKLLKRKGLQWDRHRVEDAEQELFLAGWQVWRDEGDIGLAKNRMKTRTANLVRDYWSEQRHEPKAASERFKTPGVGKSGKLWDDDANRDWDVSSTFGSMRGEPSEEASCRELLANLPERQRQVVLLRSAGYSNQEIADELGIGLRTVERELSQFRKEQEDDDE
ncbi:MAG: helix-turn-helix domain-containing protein [Planctomycetales bacterium]|nr:helix-turn-helix domain-containing protein [Planctomycetales bacterium]